MDTIKNVVASVNEGIASAAQSAQEALGTTHDKVGVLRGGLCMRRMRRTRASPPSDTALMHVHATQHMHTHTQGR
jgi:hypothetical protein